MSINEAGEIARKPLKRGEIRASARAFTRCPGARQSAATKGQCDPRFHGMEEVVSSNLTRSTKTTHNSSKTYAHDVRFRSVEEVAGEVQTRSIFPSDSKRGAWYPWGFIVRLRFAMVPAQSP